MNNDSKSNKLIIATRKSPLALIQAEQVKQALLAHHPQLTVELLTLSTQGDREKQKPLTHIGGKTLFVKELQQALLKQQADIAVHSVKDLAASDIPGLRLAAVCQREDPRDVLVSHNYANLDEIPQSSIIGTASPRRQAQLQALRPDLNIQCLRGNVGTRLKKLEQEKFAATLLAAAGLKRLNLSHVIRQYLDASHFIPAIGQGAIGIECRLDDETTQQLIAPLNHKVTQICITAERAFNQRLGGDCHTPLAAHASLNGETLTLRAMVASLDGKTILRAEQEETDANASALGHSVAQALLDQGALRLLKC